jgi:hypothetical protein
VPNIPQPIKHPIFHKGVLEAIAPCPLPPSIPKPKLPEAPKPKVKSFLKALLKQVRGANEESKENKEFMENKSFCKEGEFNVLTQTRFEENNCTRQRQSMFMYEDTSYEKTDFFKMITTFRPKHSDSKHKNR